MTPVNQIGRNCFGASMAMLTGKSQFDFPIEWHEQPAVDIYKSGKTKLVENDAWKNWRQVLSLYGYDIIVHTELPQGPCIALITLIENTEKSVTHAIVLDESHDILDPSDLFSPFEYDELVNGCNVSVAAYITLKPATRRGRERGWLRWFRR